MLGDKNGSTGQVWRGRGDRGGKEENQIAYEKIPGKKIVGHAKD